MNLVDKFHTTHGVLPSATAFNGTVDTDIVECLAQGVLFTIIKGAGAVGTTTVTVRASSDNAAAASTAVAFMYRTCLVPDTWGAWTQALAAGFATTAGANHLYQIYVPAAELASEGYGYVFMRCAELVADPIVGCVLTQIVEPSYVVQPESLLD
jgi:hypothetical protein